MKLLVAVLITALVSVNVHALSTEAASAAKVEQEVNNWRTVADAIPLGSRVKVRTIDDKRISGTLMRVDDSSVTVNRNARLPEPGVTVTFDRIVDLQLDHGNGFTWAKAVGIGLGAGAGAILTLFVLATQLVD